MPQADSPTKRSDACTTVSQPGRSWKLRVIVDGACLAALALVTTTGALLRWVLPRGPQAGLWGGFLGWARRQWRDVHAWLGLVLVVLVLVHLVLHLSWIRASLRRLRFGSATTPQP